MALILNTTGLIAVAAASAVFVVLYASIASWWKSLEGINVLALGLCIFLVAASTGLVALTRHDTMLHYIASILRGVLYWFTAGTLSWQIRLVLRAQNFYAVFRSVRNR